MGKDPRRNHLTVFVAGILAWLIPGAGHVYLRRTLRGVILCVCINGLFWSGVALGGVFTVDPAGRRWWFAAQMCTGVSAGAAWYRQQRCRRWVADEAGLQGPPTATESKDSEQWEAYKHVLSRENLALVNPTDVVACVYTGIAGMLNLMCIFDAVMLAMLGRFGEPPASDTKRNREHPT